MVIGYLVNFVGWLFEGRAVIADPALWDFQLATKTLFNQLGQLLSCAFSGQWQEIAFYPESVYLLLSYVVFIGFFFFLVKLLKGIFYAFRW